MPSFYNQNRNTPFLNAMQQRSRFANSGMQQQNAIRNDQAQQRIDDREATNEHQEDMDKQKFELDKQATALAKAKFDNEIAMQSHQMSMTQGQYETAAAAINALGNVDPNDIDTPRKLAFLRAKYADAFREVANGNHQMVSKAYEDMAAQNKAIMDKAQAFGEKLGLDPMSFIKDGPKSYLDGAPTRNISLDAMQKASEAKIAATATTLNLAPEGMVDDKITYKQRDQNNEAADLIKRKYGINAPLALVANTDPNNTAIEGGTLAEDRTFKPIEKGQMPTVYRYNFETVDPQTGASKSLQQVIPVGMAHQAADEALGILNSYKAPTQVQTKPAIQPQQQQVDPQIVAAQAWLTANPNHPKVAQVQAELAARMPQQQSSAPDALPPPPALPTQQSQSNSMMSKLGDQ